MYSELPNHNKIELKAFVDVVLGAGYQLSVYDGDDAWSDALDEQAEVLGLLGEMDSDQVHVFKNGDKVGCFWLVYGNGSGELVSDYTANHACHALYEAWATKVGYTWDGVDEDELYDFVTLYTEPGLESGVLTFQCQAESADHAEEQCKSAYPDADVVWAYRGTSAVDAVEDYLSNGSPKQ